MRPGRLLAVVLSALVLALVAVVTIRSIAPTEVIGASAPATDFSAERALLHVAVIAKTPHPVGSPAHETVRAYLLGALGDLHLDVRVQESDIALKAAAVTHAAHVKNVIARLRGTGPENAPAVMLAAHYDSVAESRGASDDGSGVATLLETARALSAGPRLKNDVVFLFTDAEEVAMCGSLAFTTEELAAHPIGVAMNFEARGTRGAVALYDTSVSNGALIEAIAKVAPRVVSTSVLGALARILPNDSDASIWKRAGIPTLAFAYVDHLYQYHQNTDALDALDPRSLQHDGDYALPLTRYFGDATLPLPASDGVVYFDVFGRTVVSYSAWFARGLALLTLGLLGWVVVQARKLTTLTPLGLVRGALVALLAVALAALGSGAAHFIVARLVPPFVRFAHPEVAAIAGVLLGAALFALPYARTLAGGQPNAIFGGLALWSLLLLVTAVIAPQASFVFQWPLLFASGAAFLWQRPEGDDVVRVDAGIALLFVPAAFFWSYLAYTVFVMVGAKAPEVVAVTVALPMLLALPFFARVGRPTVRALALASALSGSGVALVGGLAIARSPELPRPDHLTYSYEPVNHRGRWVTTDEHPDSFVAQRVKSGARANAESFDLAPLVTTTTASEEGDLHHATLTVTSPRAARCVRFWELTQEPVVRALVNGKPVTEIFRFSPETDEKIVRLFAGGTKQAGWVMEYCGAGATPFTIELFTHARKTIRLRVIETSDGLPGPALKPRGPSDGYPDSDSDVTEMVTNVTL